MRAEHERIRQQLQYLREEIDRGYRRIEMPVPETGRVQVVVAYTFDYAAMNKSAKNLLNVLVPHKQKEKAAVYRSLEQALTEEERQAFVHRMQPPQ